MKSFISVFVSLVVIATAAPVFAQNEAHSITVTVTHGITGDAIANAPLFLRAARPRGPFEPTAPKPAKEWAGFTDASGKATFAGVDADLAQRGLRLHAATVHNGVKFESPAITPANGVNLAIKVYEKGVDASGLVIANLRTVLEIWEGYVVFTQFYTLKNNAQTVLDTSLLPGAEFERGLPINLPIEAKGVQLNGPGETVVIESTAYWKGMLAPSQTVQLQARFSVTARDPALIYEQFVDYPIENVEIVVPVQTRFAKVPRLDKASLAAPDFEMLSGKGIMGLRDDMEFLAAKRGAIEKGKSFKFKLDGLPFERSMAPWAVLGVALFFATGVLVFGRREMKVAASTKGREEILAALRGERDALFEELVILERELSEGTISPREHELETIAIKERLALIMKKIGDVETSMS